MNEATHGSTRDSTTLLLEQKIVPNESLIRNSRSMPLLLVTGLHRSCHSCIHEIFFVRERKIVIVGERDGQRLNALVCLINPVSE